MYTLIFLLTFLFFAIGVLVGVRCQEINIQGRERSLATERRRVNAQIRALQAHHEMNDIIWRARNELRQSALAQAQDMPFVIDYELEEITVPRQRNGTQSHRAQESNN